jgi:hypothetical protein
MAFNFHILNRADINPDVQRDWMWELSIPDIATIVPEVSTEGLVTRIRSALIPGAEMEEITSNFMGTKQYFPGKKTPTSDMTCDFEETQEHYVYSAFQSWMTLIQNYDHTTDNSGASLMASKSNGYGLDLFLNLYTYDGQISRQIHFINTWVKSLSAPALSYEGNAQVKYSVGFKFDNCITVK